MEIDRKNNVCVKRENENCIGSSKSQDLESGQFNEVYVKVEKEDYDEENPEADDSLEDNIHQVFVKTEYGESSDEQITSDADKVYVDEEDPLKNSDDVNTLHTEINKQKMHESPRTSSWLMNENGDGINYMEYHKSEILYNSKVQDIKQEPEEDISTHFPNSGTSELIMGEPSFNFEATTNHNHGIQTKETVYVRCDHCGTSKPTKEDLQKHIYSTHYTNFAEFGSAVDRRLHKCNLCAKEFIYNSHLVTHIRSHTGEKPFNCDVCGYSTAVWCDLKRHCCKHTREKPYKCKLCDYCTANSSSLKVHNRKHAGETLYQCNHCDFNTRYNSSFKRHLRKHSGIGIYKCNRCEFSTGLKSCLMVHKRQHIGKKYKCELCTYSTSRKMHFEAHLRKHTGENLFRCHLCDYTTLRSGHLVVHVRKHTGEKPFKCNLCPYSTAQSSHLKIHLRKHSGEKPFKCTQCDYSTALKSHLRVHGYKHGGVKPFNCNVCEYTTVFKSDLKVHMTKHTGEMLNCQRCEFKTHNQSALRRHVRTHIEAKKLLKDSGTS